MKIYFIATFTGHSLIVKSRLNLPPENHHLSWKISSHLRQRSDQLRKLHVFTFIRLGLNQLWEISSHSHLRCKRWNNASLLLLAKVPLGCEQRYIRQPYSQSLQTFSRPYIFILIDGVVFFHGSSPLVANFGRAKILRSRLENPLCKVVGTLGTILFVIMCR